MKNRKKKKFKSRYWIPVGLIAAVLILILLLVSHRPGVYRPALPTGDDKPSRYLTHVLLPGLYNGAQLGEPFELVVTQEGINDIIAHSNWPVRVKEITFSGLQVVLSPGQVLMMATANVKDIHFVLTAELNPIIDENGLLTLHVAAVKIGTLNITALAKIIAGKIYSHRLGEAGANLEDLSVRITRSLINDEPFEAVFEFEDANLRIEKLDVLRQEIAVRLVPEARLNRLRLRTYPNNPSRFVIARPASQSSQ